MAYFDRAVSPGGEGNIRLTLDLKGYQGQFWKSATVISNDPQTPSITLNLRGTIRPHIEVRPSSFIRFKGSGEGELEKDIDLVTTDQPFKIIRIENTQRDKIDYHLETVAFRKHYRLTITNLQKTVKFSGMINCFTDHPQKREIQIHIYNNPDG